MTDSPMTRHVTADIDLDVTAPGKIVYQIAVARAPGLTVDENLTLTLDGSPLTPHEVVGVAGSRFHVVEPATTGKLLLSYQATVTGRADAPEADEAQLIEYLRPSRYAESDKLAAIAFREFGHLSSTEELLGGIAAWVGGHLSYVSGSSDPIDGSVDTYLLGQGVCRDYAHLVVAFLRGRDIPARLVAVYAPGLDPMDFHAVAEAYVDGRWRVVDGTLLAPRSTLLRIATGRDAADTAFLDNFGGGIRFNGATVTATVDGALPSDDPRTLVTLG
ncbi:transglutaminase-like domain-containing protein [Nakamurella deserti]|uniref:transglutaminase-like domain-containing protein n=1 Tax=Nakamurella deserti TaxID=2164074 RepID=UPI001F0BF0FB|nr:transglutaminase family protein [Nakamurella deserti]